MSRRISQIMLQNSLLNSTYIEPYAGGAGIALALLLNGKVRNVVINDSDRSLYAFWYSILNYTNEFCELVHGVDISIDEWQRQKNVQARKDDAGLLELGFSTFFLNRTNRSGIIKDAGVIGGWQQTGPYKLDCRFNKENLTERIEQIALRRQDIELYNLTAEDLIVQVISHYGGNEAFVFFDPPYFKNGRKLYTDFYSKEDHVFLERLISTKVKVPWVITYDDNEFIRKVYHHYRQHSYLLSYSASRTREGSEVMIYSHQLCEIDTDIRKQQ